VDVPPKLSARARVFAAGDGTPSHPPATRTVRMCDAGTDAPIGEPLTGHTGM
jgi:hypothetical protein